MNIHDDTAARANMKDDGASLLRAHLDEHAEWFCTIVASPRQAFASPATLSLSCAEIGIEERHGKSIISFWGTRGAEVWRVAGWSRSAARLTIEVTRRAGGERARLELTPRTSAEVHHADLRRAREEKLAQLSALLRDTLEREPRASSSSNAKTIVERARLSAGRRPGDPGRFGRVVLSQGDRRVFATGAVVLDADADAESFLAGALLWFERERNRPTASRKGSRFKHGTDELWLVASPSVLERLSAACALLRDDRQAIISIRQTANEEPDTDKADDLSKRIEGVMRSDGATENDNNSPFLVRVRMPTLAELLARVPRRRSLPAPVYTPGDAARAITAFAPEAIDVIPARHGETLRFRGLPFARVRRITDAELVWFGVEGAPARQKPKPLTSETIGELHSLIERLREHRRHDAQDRRHAFYSARGEAWLEHLLRRRITALDPGLRLAPVYAQLRVAPAASGARPVDLLALRRDDRLVVIELKVAEDVPLPFQAADYWRRAETHRRAGHLARLFGDARIADAPPLLYVVAPTLRYARSFEFLASLITPEIEVYRFDINEDWQTGVRVQRRTRIE